MGLRGTLVISNKVRNEFLAIEILTLCHKPQQASLYDATSGSLYSWSHLNFTLEVAVMKSKVWFAVPTLVLLVLVSYHANSETKPAPTVFTGKVVGITDGDTVKVLRDNQTVKIRLSGIDAPEMDQPFGKQSKRFVSKLIFGKTVDVKDLGLDRYKRTLGYITEGSTEVNEAIVAAGLAWHYVKLR
jgi:hypothetical protein